MTSKIIERTEIPLTIQQEKMLTSGWGKDSIEKANVEKIIYLSDGLRIEGYLAYPKEQKENEKFPCVIWNRGGAGAKGMIDSFAARGMFGQLASWGYVVFASMYRGSLEGEDRIGGEDVNDVLNLISIADELPFADTTKWGIEGWSRGGLMTYLILQKNHNFKCAVFVGAISDVRMPAKNTPAMTELFKHAFPKEIFDAEMFNRCAVEHANKLAKETNYLLIHGGGDDIISPLQSIEMAKKLYENEINYRLVILEHGTHYLRNHRKEVAALRKHWYEKYLMD
ncbi:MAG: prolyl oligopeptidase family serine peptidase [Ignavibacteriaceae bacterium]|jgi:dipeptidyl aminopeptidase/acylaminoacyl peptidase|nr:prolyl oligopeptidase family serine peptidase [Ignavibacteriaceae bacterium]